MKKAFLAFIAVFLLSSIAIGASAPLQYVRKFGTAVPGYSGRYEVLSSIVATDTAANRTFSLNTKGLAKLSVTVLVTQSSATGVTLTCSYSQDNGYAFAQLTSTTVATGVGTSVDYYDTHAISASKNVPFEFDVRTFDFFKCTVALPGGGGSDSFSVEATGAVGA